MRAPGGQRLLREDVERGAADRPGRRARRRARPRRSGRRARRSRAARRGASARTAPARAASRSRAAAAGAARRGRSRRAARRGCRSGRRLPAAAARPGRRPDRAHQRAHALGHRAADAAEADEAERERLERLDAGQPRLLAPRQAREAVSLDEPAVQREQQRDGVGRDLVGGVVGEVDDGDAGLLGGLEVDRVEADARTPDHADARAERGDVLGAERVRRDDDPVGLGGLARDVLGRVERARSARRPVPRPARSRATARRRCLRP